MRSRHTKLLLDDLENLLVVELGGDTLDRGQGLASITLCGILLSVPSCFQIYRASRWSRDSGVCGKKRTLDADMDVLLGLSSLPRVFVGFGEGVLLPP